MDCRRIREYLYSYIDGELDSRKDLLVNRHLSECALCNSEFEQEKRIDSSIRENIPKEKAPFTLKEVILNRIENSQPEVESRFLRLPRLLPVPAIVILVILLISTVVMTPTLFQKTRPFPLFSESISSHNKFLQGALPIEVSSDNPQNIKNWFQGKLDFALSVPDLSSKGVKLIGARLCHLREKEVAYLVYQKNGHFISGFVINTKGIKIPKAKRLTLDKGMFLIESEKGYRSILCLEKGGEIGCIFVSDLPVEELMELLS